MNRTDYPHGGVIPYMQAGSQLYGVGVKCTWHGPLEEATSVQSFGDGPDPTTHLCPKCLLPLRNINEEDFVAGVNAAERQVPGATKIMRWSRGRCFPDHDIMLNAYRQAMEE